MRHTPLFALGLVSGAVLVGAIIPTNTRVSSITVAPGGDFTLTATNPDTQGTATLTTSDVHNLHLEETARAGGHHIGDVIPGVAPGDPVVDGQTVVSPDFTGSYPNPAIAHATLVGLITTPAHSYMPGDCTETVGTIAGAVVGMVTVPVPHDVPPNGLAYVARISAPDQVTVRVCGIVSASDGARPVQVSVLS